MFSVKGLVRAGLLGCALGLAAAAPAAGAVQIHAHRGGPVANGVPVQPENSMPAFRNAARMGVDFLEMDAKLTKDRVPVIMHDATLNRTTNCSHRVDSFTLAQLRACRIDIIGTEGNSVPNPGSHVPIPTLLEVLNFAKNNGVGVNLEIKNIPTDPDFDPTPTFANTVLSTVQASGFPKSRLLIQTFWPPDADTAAAAGYRVSFLALRPFDEGAIPFAVARGYYSLEPQWPPNIPPADYVAAAHNAGLPVFPWTLDTFEYLCSAIGAGADGVITNDPPRARQAIFHGACE
jgi:glycerophosphoryl diester phosphodiesterase